MVKYKIAVVPGDCVGPEVTAEGVKILKATAEKYRFEVSLTEYMAGGAAIDAYGDPLPEETIDGCRSSDAILFGSVGGPKWDDLPWENVHSAITPSRGIQRLRQIFQLFANIRPAYLFPELVDNTPLRPEVVAGTDLIVVREQCGGLYFGEPRGIIGMGEERKGINTLSYTVPEVRRVAHVAFKLARQRRKKVTSVDKHNVMESSILWRQVVKEVAKEYPDVELNHLYADACAMKIIENPRQFDVILAGNIFGDILSDLSSVLAGSIGMMPSASIGDGTFGLYEPIHGSAPDIAGKGIANPVGSIMSVAMMLDYSFGRKEAAESIKSAVKSVLSRGYRTADLYKPGTKKVSTSEFGDLVAAGILK